MTLDDTLLKSDLKIRFYTLTVFKHKYVSFWNGPQVFENHIWLGLHRCRY